MNVTLPAQIAAIHHVLDQHSISHAFGEAIALAYCGEPRATRDIDVNIFLPAAECTSVLDVLASLFPIAQRDQAEMHIRHDAQTRLRWSDTPVDLFFSNLPYHDAMAQRSRMVDFLDAPLPVLSAEDLIICKAAFNRFKDWADIETIFAVQQQNLDTHYLRRWLTDFFGGEDERVQRIEAYIRAGGLPGARGQE